MLGAIDSTQCLFRNMHRSADLETCSAALPLAPVLFSTITGWPQASISFGAMKRARMSGAAAGDLARSWINFHDRSRLPAQASQKAAERESKGAGNARAREDWVA